MANSTGYSGSGPKGLKRSMDHAYIRLNKCPPRMSMCQCGSKKGVPYCDKCYILSPEYRRNNEVF